MVQAADLELLRAHSAAHIAAVDSGFDVEVEGVPPTDIFVSDGTPAAARLSAGCVVEVRSASSLQMRIHDLSGRQAGLV